MSRKTVNTMNGESANRFISALVKSLQTLCHGYVEFNDGIEIIGHLYLNIDSGSSFDYVVKEKVCKNTDNGTVFVSKSFQAQAPAEECITRKDKLMDTGVFEDSPTTETIRLQSAITSISNVLSAGHQDGHKPRLLDNIPHHSQNTGKRKREHDGNYMQPPYKYTTLQSSASPYFSGGSKQGADRNHSEHFSGTSHAEFFGGDSNQSSGMGRDDEDDLDLDVTFVKEEYQRNASQRGNSAGASRLCQDPSSSQSNLLQDGSSVAGLYSGQHQAPQQFASGTAGDLSAMSQNFQDPSPEVGQQSSQGPPNPRSDEKPSSKTDSEALPKSECDDHLDQPLKLEDMSGISDTLQLGIKLFGPTFVADMTAGDMQLSSVSTNVSRDNSTEIAETGNPTVFPDMFVVASGATSVKPDQKTLWLDRKDKMTKCALRKKANKLMDRFSKKINEKKIDTPSNVNGLDLASSPVKKKRGRPPKRSKNTDLKPTDEPSPVSDKIKTSSAGKSSVKSGSKDLLKRTRGSYRQYTAADKLDIIEFGIKYGSTAASRKYNIPESTVRSWTKRMNLFVMQMSMSAEERKKSVVSDFAEMSEETVEIYMSK